MSTLSTEELFQSWSVGATVSCRRSAKKRWRPVDQSESRPYPEYHYSYRIFNRTHPFALMSSEETTFQDLVLVAFFKHLSLYCNSIFRKSSQWAKGVLYYCVICTSSTRGLYRTMILSWCEGFSIYLLSMVSPVWVRSIIVGITWHFLLYWTVQWSSPVSDAVVRSKCCERVVRLFRPFSCVLCNYPQFEKKKSWENCIKRFNRSHPKTWKCEMQVKTACVVH